MHWKLVPEEKPKVGRPVLGCYMTNAGTYRIIRCMWFPAYSVLVDDIDIEDWGDYNEETDEYYVPEGWYECIDHWDDYSSIFIDDEITHWMPMPEPPTKKDT